MPQLLLHAASLSRPVPSTAWTRAAAPHLAAAGDAARAILERYTTFDGPVHDDTDGLLRGLTCVLGLDPAPEATALIARVAAAGAATARRSPGHPYAPRAAAAAVELLADRGGEVAAGALARLAGTVRNKVLHARVEAALSRVEAAGFRIEPIVDDHGLPGDGRRTWTLDGCTAVVEIEEGRARLRFERDGTPLKAAPGGFKDSAALAEVRDVVKRLGTTLAEERHRIEALLATDRDWAHAEWVAGYLEHPVTGAYGRRLIWQESTDGETWITGLPTRRDGTWILTGPDNTTAETATTRNATAADHTATRNPTTGSATADHTATRNPTTRNAAKDHTATPNAAAADHNATVGMRRFRLWHPVLAEAGEVVAWRDHLTATGLRQPFKQAFRERYRLTPAEEQTRTYSNRFAAHILRYRQAGALMRTRGWRAAQLGPWSGGDESEAAKELGGWRVSFFHETADDPDSPAYDVEFCATDQVRFARRDGTGWQVAPLPEVPARVFSEAMRDVDLFVGVTSVATDELWADGGEDRFHAYRVRTGTGALTPAAEVRRDALARVLPKLRIAGRCELGDRFLMVRGTRGAYRIHLGSGNILMAPDDTYLCVVAKRGAAAQVWLPFDDDPMLSTIISKAMLLAADDAITDPMILRQLERRQ
ncbi:DUF4132 domain-containing protein [Dactylosporangium cerinum]